MKSREITPILLGAFEQSLYENEKSKATVEKSFLITHIHIEDRPLVPWY